MQRVVSSRELITLNSLNGSIHGTYHLSPPQNSGSKPIGILFLSGYPNTRSAHGDVAVYWANAFAQKGFPSFRVDLPGMGDSTDENLPLDLLQHLTAGGYESTVIGVLEQLVSHYQLSGIIIVGHCAGAISAILAAASKLCLGIILLEAPFYVRPSGKQAVRDMLYRWSGRNRLGLLLSQAYDQIRKIGLRLRQNALPGNANFYLLKRWKQVASSGLPILLLNAPAPKTTGAQPRTGKFDYMQHILKLAGSKAQVEVKVLEGANHTFSNPHGRTAVRVEVERWIRGDHGYQV